ncbi:uncharacterized protein LOC141525814 isoform X1 [Cotesia typhae]|uniref:uncharacterized protein LOC141525814 isoform X1 n=1 Tax=Cotesia typhae TaxID=2053667 RepID=UPI003D68F3A1
MLNTAKIRFNSTALNQNSIDSDFVNPETVKGSTKSSSGDNNYFSYIEQFIAQMYDFLSMPRSLIQNLLKIVESLFSNFFSDMLNLFNNEELTLANLKIELTLIYSKIKNAFTDLDSEYKRIQHYEKSKFYVKPVVEVAGTIQKEKKVGDKKIIGLKEIKLTMIRPQDSLKLFLELPGVFKTIFNYQNQLIEESKNSPRTVFRNIVQGSLWKSLIEKHDKKDIILPLTMFFDDLETGNPLGSHAGVNKLGAVYISIPTIPPNLSSRLENILLTLLFYSKHRSVLGNEAVFKKLISDFKDLEETGIKICVNNKEINVKFIVVTFAGDNLGFNSILGFFESFKATYFCRICLTKKSDSEAGVTEDNTIIRKKEDYDKHIKETINIKELCVWHNLPNFHAYENWSFDVMHDLMEGIDRYSMALIIDNFIQLNFFSLEQLNSRIKCFLYGDLETVPPSIIDSHLKNKYVVMSASEMLSLVRNFCFIVGDLVPRNHEIWQYYISLLEINEILTSQTFTQELLEYLENIITEHHIQFQKLFGEKLKPKHHFLLHYARIIKKIGPPILVSSFKFESKHRDISRVCNSITCRKQLPLSVSIRCQLKSCFRYCSRRGFYNSVDYSKYVRNCNKTESCYSVDWYQINGIKYKIGTAILYEFNDCNEPVFGQINDIKVDKKDDIVVTFNCTILEAIEYDAHFYSYIVVKMPKLQSILINECNSQSLIIRNINENLYISINKL